MELAERLIVATDYDPRKEGGVWGVRDKVLRMGNSLQGLGVIIKTNSVLRAIGYTLISDLHDQGLQVFADLKLIDSPHTMEIDAVMLAECPPEFVTVMCCAGIEGMGAVQRILGEKTKVLGVTILTSLDEEECQSIFSCSTKAGVLRFARMAQLAGLKDLILSPQEAEMLRGKKELVVGLNTPGIRPAWSLVPGDDQRRIMTPFKAFLAGVDRIVIGRPITESKNPREAVERTLEEIQAALVAKKEASS
ncbi:MAG TPA: orotidine-5'-phosphate decarboxylase [Candidatus Paceibacterota bacterium]